MSFLGGGKYVTSQADKPWHDIIVVESTENLADGTHTDWITCKEHSDFEAARRNSQGTDLTCREHLLKYHPVIAKKRGVTELTVHQQIEQHPFSEPRFINDLTGEQAQQWFGPAYASVIPALNWVNFVRAGGFNDNYGRPYSKWDHAQLGRAFNVPDLAPVYTRARDLAKDNGLMFSVNEYEEEGYNHGVNPTTGQWEIVGRKMVTVHDWTGPWFHALNAINFYFHDYSNPINRCYVAGHLTVHLLDPDDYHTLVTPFTQAYLSRLRRKQRRRHAA